MGAAVEGIQHVYEAPGELCFRLGGQDLVLTAFNGHAPGTLSVLFTDATSGTTTYAANRSLAVAAPGPRRNCHARLQPGRQPAVRLHGPRHLPAAARGKPAAGCRCGGRTDPLRTSGRLVSSAPEPRRPLSPSPEPGRHGRGLLLLGPDGAGSHPAAWPARAQPLRRCWLRPGSARLVLAAESAGFHAATFRDIPLADSHGPDAEGPDAAGTGRPRTAQRPAARGLRRAHHPFHRPDPQSGHGLHRALPRRHAARQPGLCLGRAGRVACGQPRPAPPTPQPSDATAVRPGAAGPGGR